VFNARSRSDLDPLPQYPIRTILRYWRACANWPPFADGTAIRRLHVLLRREGIIINHKKKLRRLYRVERFQVRCRDWSARSLDPLNPMVDYSIGFVDAYYAVIVIRQKLADIM
jgi:hypothetical protein